MTELEKTDILRLSNEESNRITRDCMQKALIRLMDKESFEKISITEIVKVAGVSRNAFYRNYSSKEALLEDTISLVKERVTETIYLWQTSKDEEERKSLMSHIFENIRDNSKEFLIMLSLKKSLMDAKDIESMIQGRDTEKNYICCAHLASITGIVSRWLITGMKETPEEMSEICCRLVPARIDSY